MRDLLTASYTLAYPYKRSLGPTLSAFFTALRAGRILGVVAADGAVLVPPAGHDPRTGRDTGALVEVGPGGVVTGWTWVHHPRPSHPLDRPFALARVRLDGADTELIHAVDVAGPEAMEAGMRVAPAWRAVRTGSILDIACFVPEEVARPAPEDPGGAPVDRVTLPSRVDYQITASPQLTRFLGALMERRIIGWRDPSSGRVYVPPRGACPTSGAPLGEVVELPQTGTVTTFCVVNIPFEGQTLSPPYVCAHVLLDGADVPLLHLVGGCAVEAVKMGMRGAAVWSDVPAPTLESIRYFAPTGAPDVPLRALEARLS